MVVEAQEQFREAMDNGRHKPVEFSRHEEESGVKTVVGGCLAYPPSAKEVMWLT